MDSKRDIKSVLTPGLAGMTRLKAAAQRMASFWRRETRGNITIEFGFLIPILVMMAIGAYDFGRLGHEKIVMTSAARAGAQYGIQDFSTAGDLNGMIQAARNDANDLNNNLDIAVRQFCTCNDGSENSCSLPCGDGSFPMMSVDVTVQNNVDLLFPYPGITSPRQVATQAVMRVR